MEIRKLYLDKETTTTVHGNLYRLDYRIDEAGYKTKIYLDLFNQRIIVISFQAKDIESFTRRLDYLATNNGFDKICLKARAGQWEQLLPFGYVLEGIIKWYYNGENAYCLSKFFSRQRRLSYKFEEAAAIMEKVSRVSPKQSQPKLPPAYQVRRADPGDIQEICCLYNKVFETYPTPVNEPQYVEQLMKSDYMFVVITHENKIVSVASADISNQDGNAEITDCASLPEYRGKGLMYLVISALEAELTKQGIGCFFSIARALSPGMNTVFKKLGYTFTGRLTNNCNIYGKFEDMNLWVKRNGP